MRTKGIKSNKRLVNLSEIPTDKLDAAVHNRPELMSKLLALRVNAETISRMIGARGSAGGKSFGGKRDIYQSCGYPTEVAFEDYYKRYKRQDIARRVVNAYPDATWRRAPRVYEGTDPTKDTPFEAAWKKLCKEKRVLHYLRRLDRLAGIGQYGVLFVGYNDGLEPHIPVRQSESLAVSYFRPLHQGTAAITQWDEDRKSERYGMPLMYSLQMSVSNGGTITRNAHWSRVFHVSDELEESEVLGVPRLESVYNRLQDLEMLAGGSSEMFWRGGFPGMSFNIDPEADADTIATALNEEIDSYLHGMQRYMKLQGVTASVLNPSVASPAAHVDMQLTLISAAKGIPKRILTGSESAELASSQDQENWNSRVDERRATTGEEMILRPFVDMLVKNGTLPTPSPEGYQVEWPPVSTPTEAEVANVASVRTQTLSTYTGGNPSALVRPKYFLKMFLKMTEEEVTEVLEDAEKNGFKPVLVQVGGEGAAKPEGESAPPPTNEEAGVGEVGEEEDTKDDAEGHPNQATKEEREVEEGKEKRTVANKPARKAKKAVPAK